LGFGEASAKEHSIRCAVHFFYCAVSRSGLSLSRNEAKTQKDRFVFLSPEWLQYFFTRSKTGSSQELRLNYRITLVVLRSDAPYVVVTHS
jgi:hypothetical protein